MISTVNHTSHDLVDADTSSPISTCRYRNIKPRTEAQRQASRINGSKSKGPATIAGKNQSRRNAVKHGLRAKKFGPPADARGLDRDYKRIHEELGNEFEPVTYTECRAVAALARDFQRLDLANEMIDVHITPPDLYNETVTQQYRTIHLARREERQVANLLAALQSNESADLKPDVAARLAESVVALVNSIEEDLAESADELGELLELESRGQLCDADRDSLNELRELQQQQRQINRCRRILHDTDRLAEAFRGNRKVGKVERRVLIGLMTEIRQGASVRTHDDQNVLGLIRRAAEERVKLLVHTPDKIITLEGYREQITRSIRRNIADLRTTCG